MSEVESVCPVVLSLGVVKLKLPRCRVVVHSSPRRSSYLQKVRVKYRVMPTYYRTSHVSRLPEDRHISMVTQAVMEEYFHTCGRSKYPENPFPIECGRFVRQLAYVAVSLLGRVTELSKMENHKGPMTAVSLMQASEEIVKTGSTNGI